MGVEVPLDLADMTGNIRVERVVGAFEMGLRHWNKIKTYKLLENRITLSSVLGD